MSLRYIYLLNVSVNSMHLSLMSLSLCISYFQFKNKYIFSFLPRYFPTCFVSLVTFENIFSLHFVFYTYCSFSCTLQISLFSSYFVFYVGCTFVRLQYQAFFLLHDLCGTFSCVVLICFVGVFFS